MKIVAEHLKLCERQVIYSMRESGKGVRAIAKVIVCPPSTISRELNRKKPDLRVWSSMSSLERAKWMDGTLSMKLQRLEYPQVPSVAVSLLTFHFFWVYD